MIEKLSLLIGKWIGKGTAKFPTIKTTEYFEELEFKFIGDDETIFFEQKTWHNINNEKENPLHWESGYIIVCEDGSFELFIAQNSKRVEVMKSKILNIEKNKMHISFESIYFGNDERMVKTTRDFYTYENSLRYIMKMETKNTTEFQKHLECTLQRI